MSLLRNSLGARLAVLGAVVALVAAAAAAIISAGGSGGGQDVRILARHTEDGRTEVALQVAEGDGWGGVIRPDARYIGTDSEPGKWRASSAVGVESGHAVSHAAVGLTAIAVMNGPGGESMGTVTFRQGPRGVLIQARISGLEPGPHGFHLHETGACTPAFTAAGGHFNPFGIGHGVLDEGGHHGGDLPNLIVHDDGAGLADYYSEDVTLETGPAHSFFDADGSAVVIHLNPDSYGSDPMAGGQAACGVIVLDSDDEMMGE